MPNGVEFEGRVVHVGTFPIGIDPEKFRLGLEMQEVQARITRLVCVVERLGLYSFLPILYFSHKILGCVKNLRVSRC